MRNMIMLILLLLTVVIMPGLLAAGANEGSASDISLETLLNTKVSAAAKYEQTTGEAASSVTIITADDIERYGYRTLSEVFQSVRGLYVSNDRNYSYLGVRGFSRPTDYNNRILVLINGQTINESFYNSVSIGTELAIGLDVVERIEIVRGPGSALYGTSAMFAVINLVTKDSSTFEGIRTSVVGGSYDTKKASVMIAKRLESGLDATISGQVTDVGGHDLYYSEYDDPTTNNGIAAGLDWDKSYGGVATIGFRRLKMQAILFSREKGIPTAAYETAFNSPDAKTLDRQQLFQIAYQQPCSANKSIHLRAYYDHYYYDGLYPYDEVDEDDEPYIYEQFDSNDATRFGGELQFVWDFNSHNRLTIGSELQDVIHADYRYWDADTAYFDENFPYMVSSLYVQEHYQALKNLSLTGGVRWDNNSLVESSISPRAAIVYHPISAGTLKLLYGEAFRTPSLYEVYYDDPGLWKPNLKLKSEKIRTTEIVWEHRLNDALFATTSLYNYEMEDLIDTRIDPADSLLQFQNINQISTYGFELGFKAQLHNEIRSYLNYAYQKAEDGDSGKRLTNSPRHLIKFGLSSTVLSRFYASLEMFYESERLTVYDTKTDVFLLTNFTLSSQQLHDHVRASLQIRNLFDVNYATPGGFEHLQPAIPQDGRNVTFRLEYEL